MSRGKLNAYRLLTVVGPLMIPVAILVSHHGLHLGAVTPDTLAGVIAGAGVGLSLVGLMKLQKAAKAS